ncbi:Ig-like domain-containing protein [Lysinibacillus xylanilyticus]|uniref:Ig-like domain-containing protein n=1 Tax=Lysinibacillus xylanilyticus TaxID=582475 RepID=UPI003D0523CB
MVNLFKKGFIYLALTLIILVSINIESALAAEVVGYEEGVTNLNNTLENSAGVGSRLLKPEIGWKRYNVPNSLVKYTNMYLFSNSSSLYKGERIEGTAKDMSFTFSFEGTKFMLLDFIYSNRGTFTITIDGVSETASAKGSNSDSQTVFYKKVDLPYGKHKVEINITNNINKEYFALDAIDVDGFLISENDIPKTESITLDKNNLELLEGSSEKLTATVTPDSANVIWTSSDESIATVDKNGNVMALHEGEVIITVKIEGTDITATSTVIVKKPSNESSNAILSITLVNGITKEYDVTNKVLKDYLKWFESAQGTSTFKFSKTISPYNKVTEYIVHDKIASFEVREY